MKIRYKIAFIGYGMYAGGAEANAIHIAEHLLKNGAICHFISIKNKTDYKNQYGNFFRKIKEYQLIKNQRNSNPLLDIVNSIRGIITYFSVLRREKYDLFFSIVEYHPSLLTVIAGLMNGKRTILTVNDNLQEDLLTRPYFERFIYRIMLKFSFAQASHIVCVSHGLEDQLVSFFNIDKKKISVIHNGVDVIKIQHIRSDNRQKNTIPKIVILSRLFQKKNHLLALSAIHEVAKTMKVTCEIIGKGPMEKSLRQFVDSTNMKSVVKFKGFIKDDPYRYLKAADLFLFTSKYEGFGNAIVEAMACGLPLVSSNCKYGPLEIVSTAPYDYSLSNKEIVYDRHGVLVNTTGDLSIDSVRFSKAILNLLNNKKRLLQYGKRSLARSQYFSVERMCSSYYKLIQSLL